MSNHTNNKTIVISGCPASGKTYTASLLSKQLNIPAISKDFFKESLFDSLGFKDRHFSVEMGKASYKLLLKTASLLSEQQYSFIIENAFFAGSEDSILNSLKSSQIIQVWCDAPIDVLIKRFKERSQNGSRHPGHVDLSNIKETKDKILSNTYVPLKLSAPLINLPTTNFDSSDYIDTLDLIFNEYAKSIVPNNLS